MFNRPTKQQLAMVPKLYATDSISMKDKLVYLHFSFPDGSDWWAMEFDGQDTFFGYVILHDDFQMSEAGYFSLSELADIRVNEYLEVECDPSWTICPANEVERICIGRRWPLPVQPCGIEV